MARNNLTLIKGDITGDIYYDNFHLDSKDVQYLRLYLMIKGVVGATAVKGLRVCVYGPLAELVYGHVRKGSRQGGDRLHPAVQMLLNLKESWQEATLEEQRELVQIMLQEVACSIQEQQVTWVKPQPGFEILFKLLNDLQPDEKGRFFLK